MKLSRTHRCRIGARPELLLRRKDLARALKICLRGSSRFPFIVPGCQKTSRKKLRAGIFCSWTRCPVRSRVKHFILVLIFVLEPVFREDVSKWGHQLRERVEVRRALAVFRFRNSSRNSGKVLFLFVRFDFLFAVENLIFLLLILFALVWQLLLLLLQLLLKLL